MFMVEWFKKNVLGSIVITLLTGILYFLVQIYSVFTTLPEKFNANQLEHSRLEQAIKDEIRLREGRNESLQRQINDMRDDLQRIEIEMARE